MICCRTKRTREGTASRIPARSLRPLWGSQGFYAKADFLRCGPEQRRLHEPHQLRLALQSNPKPRFNCGGNLLCQCQNLSRGRTSAIHERQCVPRRNSRQPLAELIVYPFLNPARSISHAAEIFTSPSSPGKARKGAPASAAIFCKRSATSSVTDGFLKKLPALRQSGSPLTSSIPLLRRMLRTASAVSANVGAVVQSAKCVFRSWYAISGAPFSRSR